MKLRKVEPNRIKRGKASVRVAKSGAIHFSRKACELMKIKNGDTLSFFQDEERVSDWYVAKTEDGLVLRMDKGKYGSATLNSSSIANKILEVVNIDNKKSCGFLLGQGIKDKDSDIMYYAIITASAK